jgi:hypothetical protein
MIVNSNNTPSSDGFTKVYKVIDNRNILIEQVSTAGGTVGKVIPLLPVRFASDTAMTASLEDPRYNWLDDQLAFVDDVTSIHGYAVYQWNVGVNAETFVPFQEFDLVSQEQELIDVNKIYAVTLYDRNKNRVLLDLEVWDP